MHRHGFATICLVAFLFCTAAALAQDDQVEQHYSAVAVATTGISGGRSTTLDILIKGQTSDQEVARLVDLLQQKGQDALVDALSDKNLGTIGAAGTVGVHLVVVRIHPTETGKTVRLITIRDMPFFERFFGGRSTNYPFAMAELKVDEQGKGEGTMVVGTKFKVNDAGVLIIETYNEQTLRLLNVRRLD